MNDYRKVFKNRILTLKVDLEDDGANVNRLVDLKQMSVTISEEVLAHNKLIGEEFA